MITVMCGGGPHHGACESCAERAVGTQDVQGRVAGQVARAAFRARFEAAYLQYAAACLGDEDAGEAVVGAVWAQIEREWVGLLRCASPAGYAWRLLSLAVQSCPGRPRSALDELPRLATDAFLLRHRVGLEADRAAEAMGMDSAGFESLYRSVVPRFAA